MEDAKTQESVIKILAARLEELEEKNHDIVKDNERKEHIIEALQNGPGWCMHRFVDESKMEVKYPGYSNLPLPRIEMRVIIDDAKDTFGSWNVEYLYGLVYRTFSDNQVYFIPISQTLSRGGNGIYNKVQDATPFRDSLHIRVDMVAFQMPGYWLFNGKIYTVEEVQTHEGRDLYGMEHIEKCAQEVIRKP